MQVAPANTPHMPVAEEESWIMPVESAGARHTGKIISVRTKTDLPVNRGAHRSVNEIRCAIMGYIDKKTNSPYPSTHTCQTDQELRIDDSRRKGPVRWLVFLRLACLAFCLSAPIS